ncbi:MAG: 50S ribosomal protein L10 [Chlamydiae bacterium]|jgi:large subunit ribosomal protein L10|nr:50S ribosomal protein L10 [Chlamydiota bacterium]
MLAEKELFLEEVKGRIDPSVGFVLASYRGINANGFAGFRSRLVEAGGDFFVIKKRVFVKAAKDLNLEYDVNELDGHVGLAFTKDNFLSLTKALYSFKKENDAALTVIGGHFEGKKCSSQDVELISKLPTLLEMRAQFLGLLEAPMTQTLGTIQAMLTSVIYCLDNKAKKE